MAGPGAQRLQSLPPFDLIVILASLSSAWGVEACGATRRLQLGDLLRRDEEELGLRIEKPTDEPAGAGPVDSNSCASEPFHHYTSVRNFPVKIVARNSLKRGRLTPQNSMRNETRPAPPSRTPAPQPPRPATPSPWSQR